MKLDSQTLFLCSPEQFSSLLDAKLAPMAEELAFLRSQVGQKKDLLTIQDVCQLTGFGEVQVRRWIKDGVVLPGRSRREHLRIVEGLSSGIIRIRYSEYERFLALFPDVRDKRQKRKS